MNNASLSECIGLRIVDSLKHHRCYNWTEARAVCESEWPCEVRQYLVRISPLISVTRGLLSYGTVFIIVLGLFLNSLSFYVLKTSGLSKSGSGIYLMTLAVCDCGNLVTNYAIGVARGHSSHFNRYFTEYEWLCRFHAVFVEIFQLISAWVVVTFTVERCIAVWYPMLLRNMSRTRRARIVIAVISAIFTVFSLSKLFLTGFESDSVFGYPPCPSHRYRWPGMAYIGVAFQTWIPTIMVFVFNCLMFHKLRQVKRARRRLTEYKRPSAGPLARQSSTTRKQSFINRPSPTAPMLVAVSLAYLLLVFPLGVVQTVELFWNVHSKHPVHGSGSIHLKQQYVHWFTIKLLLKYLRSFFFGLYQCNFAINFFLYFAAGLQFRLHLQHKIKAMLKKAGADSPRNFQERSSKSLGDSFNTSSVQASSSKSTRKLVRNISNNVTSTSEITATDEATLHVEPLTSTTIQANSEFENTCTKSDLQRESNTVVETHETTV